MSALFYRCRLLTKVGKQGGSTLLLLHPPYFSPYFYVRHAANILARSEGVAPQVCVSVCMCIKKHTREAAIWKLGGRKGLKAKRLSTAISKLRPIPLRPMPILLEQLLLRVTMPLVQYRIEKM